MRVLNLIGFIIIAIPFVGFFLLIITGGVIRVVDRLN
jgi:hypothetical protein